LRVARSDGSSGLALRSPPAFSNAAHPPFVELAFVVDPVCHLLEQFPQFLREPSAAIGRRLFERLSQQKAIDARGLCAPSSGKSARKADTAAVTESFSHVEDFS
jgi:hypothetical protein